MGLIELWPTVGNVGPYCDGVTQLPDPNRPDQTRNCEEEITGGAIESIDFERMDERREIFRQVFGESETSGSDIDDYDSLKVAETIPRWEQIKEVNGLWICRNFLSLIQQSSIVSAILREGWFSEAAHNQAMRFGDLPEWAGELSSSIREALLGDPVSESATGEMGASPLPSDLLWREPLFDQLIANVYQPGEGICAHVDLMRFEDGIAIVSFESSCVMHFSRVVEVNAIEEQQACPSVTKIPVYLNPGSVVLMSGEARYLWKHEINRKPGFQKWEGEDLNQQRRISLTLRKLCPVR